MIEPPEPHSGTPASDMRLEDQMALVLGRMMLRFAALEATCRILLQTVLDLDTEEDKKVIYVLSGISFRKSREALLASARAQDVDPHKIESLKAILRRAARIEERRNALTHSVWIYSDLPEEISREKRHIAASGNARTDQERFSDVNEILSFVQEIDLTCGSMFTWLRLEYLGVGMIFSSVTLDVTRGEDGKPGVTVSFS